MVQEQDQVLITLLTAATVTIMVASVDYFGVVNRQTLW